jgi:hypothetical protein
MATTLTKHSLDALSKKINAAHSNSISAFRTTIDRAIECGHLLNEAKSQVKHGDWLAWLEKNCPSIHRKTASGWMRIAASNVTPTLHLGVEEAIKLISGKSAETEEKPKKPARITVESKSEPATNGKPHDPPSEPENDARHTLPIPEREAGDEPPEIEHRAPEAASTDRPNKKLDFDDKIIDQAFSKLIKAVDDRATALKQKQSAYHKTCINRLDAFMVAFKEWKAVRR